MISACFYNSFYKRVWHFCKSKWDFHESQRTAHYGIKTSRQFSSTPIFLTHQPPPNVVGYTTVNAPVGRYVMVGSQFTSCNSEAMDLQDFVKGTFTAVDYDDDYEWLLTSPCVLIHNGVGYDNYYYQTDAQGTGDSPDGWVDSQAIYVEDLAIAPGTGFWFIDNNAADGASCQVTFAGQVPESGYTLETKGTAYNMVANPFPIDLPINSNKITWGKVTAVDYDDDYEWLLTSPCVLIYNGTGYDNYYYQTDAQGTGDSPDGWVDSQAVYADAISFAPATGWWFKNNGDASIKFTR